MIARVARAVQRRAGMARHRGDRVSCPLCGGRWDGFKADWNRPDALCWGCGAHERHRAQGLLLLGGRDEAPLPGAGGALLHFAPEHCLRGPLAARAAAGGWSYVTGDLDPAGVDLRLDLMGLDVPDDAYDAVVCSHVLEHVPDADRGMRELRRITRPGGWCLVLVPLDLTRKTTYEDPSITTPEGRLAAFWQEDHVRLFAPDIEPRLAAAGFAVEVVRPADAFGADLVREHGLLPSDWLFVCR